MLMEHWYLKRFRIGALVHALSCNAPPRDSGTSKKLGVHTLWPQFGGQQIVRFWKRHRIREQCMTFE